MKNKVILLSSLFVLLAFNACDKDLELPRNAEAYTYTNVDDKAGQWKLVFLSSVSDITVATPVQTTSPEYQTLLSSLKSSSSSLTSEQKNAIDYWGANSITKWNEIARTLAARYNLPPAANADGTYPVPSSVEPGKYPYFPFANPPYASRAFAYLATAQFDALIVAWKYKYDFNRSAPYKIDNSIKTSLPAQELPSYPSEDAVIADVSLGILRVMFPNDTNYLKEKALELKNSRLWAGMNTQDEIDAGASIGKQVAAKFINDRAKKDNMGKAIGSIAETDSLAALAEVKYGWRWRSLEFPIRPGMLPKFGEVKPWCIPDVATVRPGPPPAPGTAEFLADAVEIKDFTKNPTEETRCSANFWADGPSTSTPPGHWNEIACKLILRYKMNPIRTARTLAYMNMAVEDAGISCWDTKYFYNGLRPSNALSGFRTLIGVPNFPGYISGHSTFSAAGAEVLAYIFPNDAALVNSYAIDASNSRIYGGIHFRVDCVVGLQTGKKVAGYAIAKARADGSE
ncbi:MAG: phosphatase PAP2 family protein [Saprospiraceae bacterium]